MSPEIPVTVARLDPESAGWPRALADAGPQRDTVLARPRELLIRVARGEVPRRGLRLPMTTRNHELAVFRMTDRPIRDTLDLCREQATDATPSPADPQGGQQMRSVTRTGRGTPATEPGPRPAGTDRRVTIGLLAAAATVAFASCIHLGERTPPGFTTPAPAAVGLRTTEVTYPGGTEHIRAVRADLRTVLDECPRADDVILCASELAANAAQHSRSRLPGGTFTVRAAVSPGRYARVEVQDNGGPWNQAVTGSARYHGLDIIRAVADAWGIGGGHATRTVWARFDWPE